VPSPAQTEARERLLARIESNTQDSGELAAIGQEVGTADLDPADRDHLLDRIMQYTLDDERWRERPHAIG
jgi:hypothetical protein